MSEINIDNVLIVFDAERILEECKTPSIDPSKPSFITNADNVIFMMAKRDEFIKGHGGANLDFRAHPSDIIRWRETTLERNTGRNVQLYEYQGTSTGVLITAPAIQPVSVTIPIPNPNDPLHPKQFQKVADYLWQSTVLDIGNVVYTFKFMILKRDGSPLGYFKWDPRITITNS